MTPNKTEPSNLMSNLVSSLNEATMEKCAEISVKHAELNMHFSTRSILDLKNANLPKSDAALVIAAGPSLHRNKVADQIKASGFDGTLVATESAMAYCLRNGITPHVVVTLDPHPKRIVRWFGDTDLSGEDLSDDYYRRQDLDPNFRDDEIRRNQELINLVNKNGLKLHAAVATCASQAVVARCRESGMQLYWWNPLFDDYGDAASLTQKVFKINSLPCLNTGGNVGTAAWVIAHAILGKKEIAVTGMDFSYYADTGFERTQYYYELLNLLGEERLHEAFLTIHNPFLNTSCFTDPTYYWYRESFLELAQLADCHTYNCTEGGILFGQGVEVQPLKQFLSQHQSRIKTTI